MPTPYTTRLGHASRRITYRDIAHKAGVSYSMVAKVAAGTRTCSPAIAQAIRDLLGVEPEVLFPPPEPRTG